MRVVSDFLLKLTDWVIHNNIFLCMKYIYIYTKDWGSYRLLFSPDYACLFLGLWEKEYCLNPVNPFHHYITWYGHYIHDVLFIFDGGETQFLDFHKYLNCINHNIKLSID